MSPGIEERIDSYTERVNRRMRDVLPDRNTPPARLHQAMHYAVLNGGKKLRPLLAYAAAECVAVPAEKIDAAAVAVELIHAFSLVHDDLPAMDDDDLRRGKPTVHIAFDEATAILAADALQPLAFSVLANAADIGADDRVRLIALLAAACGSTGMTGGQSLDLSAEGTRLDIDELEFMFALKTGALIHAAVFSAALLTANLSTNEQTALDRFGRAIGIAFQIRDDLLEVEGETAAIGKPAGSDAARNKATYPAIAGVDAARQRCQALYEIAMQALDGFGERAALLRELARIVVERAR